MLQVRLATLPRQIPVSLLTATEMELPPALKRLWVDEQTKWAAIHPNVRQVLIKSGHRIPQQNPGAVVEAVRQALALVSIDKLGEERQRSDCDPPPPE
jgi:hypothetical protein